MVQKTNFFVDVHSAFASLIAEKSIFLPNHLVQPILRVLTDMLPDHKNRLLRETIEIRDPADIKRPPQAHEEKAVVEIMTGVLSPGIRGPKCIESDDVEDMRSPKRLPS